jgi:RNA polymerase primary sigma factor
MVSAQAGLKSPRGRIRRDSQSPTDPLTTGRQRTSSSEVISRKTLATPVVEFVHSPEFDRPDSAAAILAPKPAAPESVAVTVPPADTPPYLARLYTVPLLTRDQEFHLFRQMNFLKFRANQLLTRSTVTPAARRQAQQWLTDARRLRNEIVEANLRLVVSIAKTLADATNPLEDLISEGNVPLMRAAEIFDFTRGLRFSTYATWAVRHRLYRCVPRNRRQARQFVSGTETEFSAVADIRVHREKDGDSKPLQRAISRWLSDLPTRERTIVEARFGLGRYQKAGKFREIAEDHGISTERARQLYLRAVEHLRNTTPSSSPDVLDLLSVQ